MKETKSAVKSVENAFTALEFIVEMTLEKEGAMLGEIAEKLGMRKTTARNLLQTMELCGYVTGRGFGFYRLGNRFRSLLLVSETANRLKTISMPALQKFCKKNSLPVHLSVFFNGKRHTSLCLNAEGIPLENSSMADTPENVYRRASTRLLLAYSSPEERARFLADFGLPEAGDWPEGARNLEQALRLIRENGCAVNDTNRITNLVGMAAGIFDQEGRLCAAISCAVPKPRHSPEGKNRLLNSLQDTARQLTGLFAREKLLI